MAGDIKLIDALREELGDLNVVQYEAVQMQLTEPTRRRLAELRAEIAHHNAGLANEDWALKLMRHELLEVEATPGKLTKRQQADVVHKMLRDGPAKRALIRIAEIVRAAEIEAARET